MPANILPQAKGVTGESPEHVPSPSIDPRHAATIKGLMPPSLNVAEAEMFYIRFKEVVAMVMLLRDHLPPSAMADLAGRVQDEIQDILQGLQIVLRSADRPSFLEFICNRERCVASGVDTRLVFDKKEYEGRLALWCFRCMEQALKGRLLGDLGPVRPNQEIADLMERLDKALRPEERYAVRHWASHLSEAHPGEGTLAEALEAFTSTRMIWWLEAMSLLECIPIARNAVINARQWAVSSQIARRAIILIFVAFLKPKTSQSVYLLNDVHRVLLSCSEWMANSASHLYWSALPFLPKDSPLFRVYNPRTNPTLDLVCGSRRSWPDLGSFSIPLGSHGTNAALCVSFSSDGSLLAAGTEYGPIFIWEFETITYSHFRNLTGHTDSATSLTFSPHGRHLASGSKDNKIIIWDTTSGAIIHELNGHTAAVTSVSFSADGVKLASGSDDMSVVIWNLPIDSIGHKPTGGNNGATIVHRLKGHTDGVTSVCFFKDNDRIVSGSSDQAVIIWNITSGSIVHRLTAHSSSVTSVSVAPDDSEVVSGSNDESIIIWDALDGTVARHLPCHTGWVTSAESFSINNHDSVVRANKGHSGWVTCVAFSSKDRRVASGSHDESIIVRDSTSGCIIHSLESHTGWVTSIAFSSDGRLLASGSSDKSVIIWDSASGSIVHKVKNHTSWVTSVAFSPDGKRVSSGSYDTTIVVFDTASTSVVHTLQGHTHWVTSVVFSRDGALIASGSNDKTVIIWDATRGCETATMCGHTGCVASVAFSPDGSQVASGSHDKSIIIWDALKGDALRKLEGHSASVASVNFSPDGSHLVSGSSDTSAIVWSTSSWAIIHKLSDGINRVASVAFAPNGVYVAMGTRGDALILWDPTSGCILPSTMGHTKPVTSVSFSPDGRRLVSSSADRTILIWDLTSASVIHNLTGHTHSVQSAKFSPDGCRVASASLDNTVVIWDAFVTSQPMPRIHEGSVFSLSLSPDNMQLASGSADKTVIIWDATSGYIRRHLKQYTSAVFTVSFSSEGDYLETRTCDEAVFWDPATWEICPEPDSMIGPTCNVDPPLASTQWSFLFEIDVVGDRKVYADRCASQERQLICIIPSWVSLNKWTGEQTQNESCLALGCGTGEVVLIRLVQNVF